MIDFLLGHPFLFPYMVGWIFVGLVTLAITHAILRSAAGPARAIMRRDQRMTMGMFAVLAIGISGYTLFSLHRLLNREFPKMRASWESMASGAGRAKMPNRNLAEVRVRPTFPELADTIAGLAKFRLEGLPATHPIQVIVVPLGYNANTVAAALKHKEVRYYPEFTKDAYVLADLTDYRLDEPAILLRGLLLMLWILGPMALSGTIVCGLLGMIVAQLIYRFAPARR